MMAEQQTPTNAPPTAEEQAQAQQVAAAGAQAAVEGRDTAEAMRQERDRTGLKMSDDEITRVAEKLNELQIKAFEDRGAFEAPPDRVQAPPPETAPPPPGEQNAGAPPEGEQPPQPPQKRTAAHRFFGVN